MSSIEAKLYALVITEQERDMIIDGLDLLQEDYIKMALDESVSQEDKQIYSQLSASVSDIKLKIRDNHPLDIKQVLNSVFNDKETEE